jgi:sorbose reductase
VGTFFSAQEAANQMLAQNCKGSIVMIASIVAHTAIPAQTLAAYGASKSAVKGLGLHLGVELAPHNIRVNTISPGFIRTDMTAKVAAQTPALAELFDSAPPMKRMGERGDLMSAVVYLLSDASAYTTAADLPITGGLHAGRIDTS